MGLAIKTTRAQHNHCHSGSDDAEGGEMSGVPSLEVGNDHDRRRMAAHRSQAKSIYPELVSIEEMKVQEFGGGKRRSEWGREIG